MIEQHKRAIIDKASLIGLSLTDNLIGDLSKKGIIKTDEERFAALLVLEELRRKIYPIIDEIRMIADKY